MCVGHNLWYLTDCVTPQAAFWHRQAPTRKSAGRGKDSGVDRLGHNFVVGGIGVLAGVY